MVGSHGTHACVFFYGWPLVYRRYSLFAGPGARFSQYKYPETLELESSSWPYFIVDMLLWFAAVLSVAAVVWALTTRRWGWQLSLGNMLLLVFWLGLLQGILRYEWSVSSTLHLRQIRAPDAVYVPAMRSPWWLAVLLIFGALSVIYVAGRVFLRWLARESLRWRLAPMNSIAPPAKLPRNRARRGPDALAIISLCRAPHPISVDCVMPWPHWQVC